MFYSGQKLILEPVVVNKLSFAEINKVTSHWQAGNVGQKRSALAFIKAKLMSLSVYGKGSLNSMTL